MTASTRTIRWGIVSTGGIARVMAGELRLLEDSIVAAVSSRTAVRARAFADEFGIPVAHGSFEDLIDDPHVDVVYVATPHAQHPPIVRAALEAGKPVLVEKSMTTSLSDTEDLVELARRRGVFLMEAMWTRFVPTIVRTRQIIADGAIGAVRSVTADLGFVSSRDPAHRLWDPRQGGGATLDLLVYPAALAQMVVLGDPESLTATGSLSPEGVDVEAGVLLGYDGGVRAFLDSSLIAAQPGAATIVGTEGRIEIPPRFHHPTLIRHVRSVAHGQEDARVHESRHEGQGRVPMLRAVAQAVREGRTECPEMPLSDSVAVMRILQGTLDALGVLYPDPDPVVAHGRVVGHVTGGVVAGRRPATTRDPAGPPDVGFRT